ncbi:MAG: hypothetical protein WA895_29245 [Streptosporangiaceae bacterium]
MNSGDSLTDRGRIRQALVGVLRVLGKVGVLRVLGKAAASEAQKIVITMGDDLIREIGQDVMHQLPH